VTKTFTSTPREPGSISSNHLTCLAYDRVGRLWTGTAESGVSRLSADGKTWELVNAFDGLPKDSVTALTVTGDTLWIGTRGGIALWNGHEIQGSLPDGNTVSFDTTFSLPAISGIALLSDTLWLSTPRGVGFARTTTGLSDWRPANAGLPTLEVDHLVGNGREVLVQVNATIYRWVPDSSKWLPTDPLSVVHDLRDENGVLYATSSAGMFRYSGYGVYTQIPGAPVGTPQANDDPEPGAGPSGSLDHYAGTRAGLWEETAPGSWTLRVPPGPPGNTYCNIVTQGGNVYAATRNEGIGRWDGSAWYAWPPVTCSGACPNAFRNANEVFAMLADGYSQRPNGNIWVACWSSAMDYFDDSVVPAAFTHLWVNAGDDGRHTLAFGSAADSNGGRWFGMDTNDLGVIHALGLDHYDAFGAFDNSYGPGNSQVRVEKIRAVTVDKTGRVWVGYAGSANSGVDHFVGVPDYANQTFRTVPNTSALDIWGLVARDNDIWVLTDHDLKRIDRGGNPPKIVQAFSTPGGRPLGMRLIDASPDGSVWVGTEEGVRWYHPGGTSQDFTTANSPLASNDVRAIAVDRASGVVWMGTAEGLNRFDPGYRPPGLAPGTVDTLSVYPNPALVTGIGLELRLQGAATAYAGGIYDLNGRLLHSFSIQNKSQVVWDGRDRDGRLVRPGIYFVRAESGGRQARARFVLLH
jgi:hypothetical protein